MVIIKLSTSYIVDNKRVIYVINIVLITCLNSLFITIDS